MRIRIWTCLVLLLAACRGGAPASPTAAYAPRTCPPATVDGFPLHPDAREEKELASARVADARYSSRAFVVEKPLREVLAFYRFCLKREETSESEEGSRHFQQGAVTLTLSGSSERTYIRVSRTR